jgi:2-phosphoglycerate kinase
MASRSTSPSRPRLILINGPPGIGKSTLARRYADDHPGVLDCDIDVVRCLIGGWREDFGRAGALIRPLPSR